MIAPAHLVKVFGLPEIGQHHSHVSGMMSFEDNNLDVFTIFDFKATQAYWGPNREDEYYDNPKNLRKPLHKRKQRRPTVQEFWQSEEPYRFRIAADTHSDLPKFRRWMRKQVEALTPESKSFQELNHEKFVKEVGICHGEWDKKAEFCHDVMAFEFDWTYYLTPAELKTVKQNELPAKVNAPTAPDLDKAERVAVDREAIKLEEMEREASKLKAT